MASSENHRFFQELDEDEIAFNIAGNYFFEKNEEDEFDAKLTFGYNGRFKSVDFKATQFNFRINKKTIQPTISEDNLDGYFNQNGIDNKYFKIETFRGDASISKALNPQTYNGNQYINGGFTELEYKFSSKFTTVIGLKFEHIFQEIKWETALDPSGSKNTFTKFEFLPSASFKYELTEDQNLKLAISKSYTLPQYKEKAPFQFEEVTQIKFGNSDLYPSTNYNADVRWEYFPKRGEVISVTGFGKVIINPINEVVVASATNDISYVNTGSKATIFGAEFELRKQLFAIENLESEEILANKLTAGFNASYMYSNQDFDNYKVIKETKLSVNFSNKEGRLTGASDLILNADLSYHKEFSTSSNIITTLSYSFFSDRVYAIGSSGKGDIIDKGISSLDFILKYKIFNKFKFGFSIKNLLNPTIKRVQDTQNVEVLSFKKGINAGISLRYKL